MKTADHDSRGGSVLVTAMLTITIMTLICATSLYVTSQEASAGVQAASWHQALTGAESGVDAAIRALNATASGASNAWSGWVQMSQSGTTLPSTEPTPSSTPSPSGAPDTTHYNVLPSSQLTVSFPNSEGAASVASWVTVDTGGMDKTQDTNGKQWYRIRSTGRTLFPTNSTILGRLSNNRLDNDLRNTIALRFNRKTGTTSNLGPARTIEVIMYPVAGGWWQRGVTAKSGLQMSGSGTIDSFKSSAAGSTHQWALAYRRNHGDVGLVSNTTNSDLRSTYIYGNVSYSGTAVKNTTNVQGTVSTPFSASIPTPVDPTTSNWWQNDGFTSSQPYFQTISGTPNYTTYTGGNSLPKDSQGNTVTTLTASGPVGSPNLIKITGGLTIPGGTNLLLQKSNSGTGTGSDTYVIIWITGKFTTSGSGYITQNSGVHVTWIVDNDITVSGTSYQNNTGYAANNAFVGVGTSNKFTDSGSAVFTGTLLAPGYDATISGSGDFSGAIVTDTLTVSGGASIHYDEDLAAASSSSSVGNYAFASWFEDNSLPNHKDSNGNYIIY
jgi:hypothetical protein